MSEIKKSFMEELDMWSEANVVGPLFNTDTNQQDWESVVEQVKKAIRTKVLESYHNGQQQPARARKPGRGGRYGR